MFWLKCPSTVMLQLCSREKKAALSLHIIKVYIDIDDTYECLNKELRVFRKFARSSTKAPMVHRISLPTRCKSDDAYMSSLHCVAPSLLASVSCCWLGFNNWACKEHTITDIILRTYPCRETNMSERLNLSPLFPYLCCNQL